MNWRAVIGSAASFLVMASQASATPPYATPADIYRNDRRAVDVDFDRQEDALRHSYKALRQQEEDAWRAARKSAPPQARKAINQQFAQRKKELARGYVAQRKTLDAWEDQARDAVRSNYLQTLRYPVAPPPVYWRPVTPVEPHVLVEPRVAPPYFEELPPPGLAPIPGARDL